MSSRFCQSPRPYESLPTVLRPACRMHHFQASIQSYACSQHWHATTEHTLAYCGTLQSSRQPYWPTSQLTSIDTNYRSREPSTCQFELHDAEEQKLIQFQLQGDEKRSCQIHMPRTFEIRGNSSKRCSPLQRSGCRSPTHTAGRRPL